MRIEKQFIKRFEAKGQSELNYTDAKLVVSKLNAYHQHIDQSPYSVKVVTNGLEKYVYHNQVFNLKSNQYLIVNKDDAYDIAVETTTLTDGICIYPPEDLIREVYVSQRRSENDLLDQYHTIDGPLNFTQSIRAFSESRTGAFLTRVLPYVHDAAQYRSNLKLDEFYIQLAECLVHDQLTIDGQLKYLPSAKRSTKEELFRRLERTKAYIHDHQSQKLNIEDLAAIACLSKYHFVRSFKAIYKMSPYQYLMSLKLDAAAKLIKKGHHLVQVSESIGFSDPKNLRKALKKMATI